MDEDTREILKSIGELDTKVEAFIASQTQICKAAHAQMAEHHKTMFGNGQKGLCSRLQDLEGKVNLVWLGVVALVGTVFKVAWDVISTK